MPGAVLHDRVTGLQGDLGAVVEFEHDGASEHHFEVDGVGGVHAGIRRIHVAHHPGKLGLHVRQPLLGVEGSQFAPRYAGRHSEHAEPETANGRKVRAPVGHRAVVGKLRRLVPAPQQVKLGLRHHLRSGRFHRLIADEHGLSGRVVPGHYSTDIHGVSQAPPSEIRGNV